MRWTYFSLFQMPWYLGIDDEGAVTFLDTEIPQYVSWDQYVLTDDFDPYIHAVRETVFCHCAFPYPIKPYGGSAFQQEVWQALQRVSYGETCSYANLAKSCQRPKATRAVANAVGANPCTLLIPCHRVIRTDGTLGGFRLGRPLKKYLLTLEQHETIPLYAIMGKNTGRMTV